MATPKKTSYSIKSKPNESLDFVIKHTSTKKSSFETVAKLAQFIKSKPNCFNLLRYANFFNPHYQLDNSGMNKFKSLEYFCNLAFATVSLFSTAKSAKLLNDTNCLIFSNFATNTLKNFDIKLTINYLQTFLPTFALQRSRIPKYSKLMAK